jgi:hypothetical protein
MATELEITRLRRDIGANEYSLGTNDANDLFTEAAESYTAGTAAYYAYVRIIAIRGIRASAAKMTTYSQNQSSENASDVFKHLGELLKDWQKELAGAENSGGRNTIRATKRMRRIREYPG